MTDAQREIISLLQQIKAAAGGGGGAVDWGAITGTLSNQTDLQTQLDAKGPAPSDAAYNEATWNGVTTIAPSKNAVRDKIESMAHSGGFIGMAWLSIDNAGEATVDFANGIFTGMATPFAAVSSGALTVTFPAGQPNAEYYPDVLITDSQGDVPITVIIPEATISTGSFVANLIISNTGAFSSNEVNKVRIKVSRLSQ